MIFGKVCYNQQSIADYGTSTSTTVSRITVSHHDDTRYYHVVVPKAGLGEHRNLLVLVLVLAMMTKINY